jgi:hypothetical protein
MIESTRFEGNEIITTGDANNTATKSIENLDFAFDILGADQIVYGFTVSQTATPSMGIAIESGCLFDSANNKFLRKDADTLRLAVTASDSTLTRRDTVEIRRQTVDYDSNTRQFKDPETKAISSLNINTKIQYDVEIKVLAGTPGNNAPAVESGWKKIAEIHVPASALTVTNANIVNCSAPLSGEVNTGWTTETMSIYRQGTMSELKQYIIDSIPEGKNIADLVERTTLDNNDLFYVVNPSGVTPEQIDLKAKMSTIKTKIRTDELTGTATKLVKFKTGGGVEASLTISDVVIGSEVTGTEGQFSVFKSGGRGVENGLVKWSLPVKIGNTLGLTETRSPIVALSGQKIAMALTGADVLRTYYFDGTTWSVLGNSLTITGMQPVAVITAFNETDIAFYDGGLDQLRCYRFDGTDWALVGSALSVSGGSAAITAINSTDIAFVDNENDSLRCYRFNGSTWSLVGSGLSVTAFTGVPTITSLSETDIAFFDDAVRELRCYRFNGSTWSLVGSGLSISSATSTCTMAALNNYDVAFAHSNGDYLTIYRFNGATWAEYGGIRTTVSLLGDPAITALSNTDIALYNKNGEDLEFYRFGVSVESPYRWW